MMQLSNCLIPNANLVSFASTFWPWALFISDKIICLGDFGSKLNSHILLQFQIGKFSLIPEHLSGPLVMFTEWSHLMQIAQYIAKTQVLIFPPPLYMEFAEYLNAFFGWFTQYTLLLSLYFSIKKISQQIHFITSVYTWIQNIYLKKSVHKWD